MENESNEPKKTISIQALPVIPTPRGLRWREFRITCLPILVFCAGLVVIWRLSQELPPAGAIRGIGDGAMSILASPHDGFIQNVRVEPFGWAEAGEPILTVVPFDPRSTLDLFQSQLQILRFAFEPSIADRTALDYEQVRVDSLRFKQELAMAQANLDRALKVLPRHEALLKDRLISKDIYDLTVRDRDFYQAEVQEKAKAIKELDERLQQLRKMSEPLSPGSHPVAEEIIPRLEEQMSSVETNWSPITLEAPISGEVQFYRRGGEFVRAGEPLLMINAARADRIIAYLKQPRPFEPEVGMTMEVITRSTKPKRFLTQIAQIGARVEILTNAIAYIPVGALVDSGLPLILPVPPRAEVSPGEVVDVHLKSPTPDGTILQRLFKNRK